MVHCALFIVPKSPFYAGSWLQKNHYEKTYAQLCGDRRQTLESRAHAASSICFTLHTCRQESGWVQGGALRESPWGLLFCWALNAYCNSCRHKCVMSGKTCCWTSNHPKSPEICTSQQGGVNPALQWNSELFFFFFRPDLVWRFEKPKEFFEGLDQTRSSRWSQTEQTFALNRSQAGGRIL